MTINVKVDHVAFVSTGEKIMINMDGKDVAKLFFTKGKNNVLYATLSNMDGTMGVTLPVVEQASVLDVVGGVFHVSN